jgi:hypothetical protein
MRSFSTCRVTIGTCGFSKAVSFLCGLWAAKIADNEEQRLWWETGCILMAGKYGMGVMEIDIGVCAPFQLTKSMTDKTSEPNCLNRPLFIMEHKRRDADLHTPQYRRRNAQQEPNNVV